MAEGSWRSTYTEQGLGVPFFAPGSRGQVIARFSNFKGEPARDDGNRTPHGLAVRLDGGATGTLDLVLVDIRRFPTATREDFVSMTRAFGTKGLARAWQVSRMIFGGRSSLIAFGGFVFGSRPTSYVTRTYHGLNAFYWALEDAAPIPVRYVATPVDDAGRRVPGAVPSRALLDNDLRARLAAQEPVRFDVHLVLGKSPRGRRLGRHRIDNALRRWPESNRRWLCQIELERYRAEGDIPVRFDPLDLPHGITPSDDEILLARRAAYPASYLRRVSAGKVPL
jgi:catalase